MTMFNISSKFTLSTVSGSGTMQTGSCSRLVPRAGACLITVIARTDTWQQEALSFPNVQLHVAPMPEMFGTHHSKMMILFRHDSTAQVVIHTANMIPKDWTNLTNAVWMSPMLPKLDDATATESNLLDSQDCPLGSGAKFKTDLLNYLRSYDSRRVTCKALVDQLSGYDFSTVNATLVASVPGRHDVNDVSQTPWGWVALGRHLKSVHSIDGDSEVVVQISSIATLGAKDDWLQKTLFQSLAKSANTSSQRPRFKIIFPTQDEIRGSLGGYASGGSIHMRIQSQQQAKQLQYMRPIFHRWANTGQADIATRKFDAEEPEEGGELHGSGCRERAAPHIKTYIRYNSKGSLDWALLTSANLSKQAWGEAVSASNMVRIASWEIGVLFWPSLFSNDTVMVPTLMADTPSATQLSSEAKVAVGIRVPYGLPLSSYKGDDVPWVASMAHTEPDWSGRKWP